jgi:outer membrane protein assembly factor BamB
MIPIPNALKVTLFSRYYNLEYELRAFHVATGCFYTGSKGGQVLRFAFNAGSSRWEVRARSGPEGEGIKAIARHHGSETLFIGTSGGAAPSRR